MRMAQYLGTPAPQMLAEVPFKNWKVKRSVDNDPACPAIHYVFRADGLELRCDLSDKVSVIFLNATNDKGKGFDESLLEFPFSWSRQQVQETFGVPSESGQEMTDPILGKSGAWDRYTMPGYAIHFEYRTDHDSISIITLMREETGDTGELILFPIPSLVATLLNRERAKGSPLTEQEVLQIRDECPARALRPEDARKIEESRGYKDIDPENCWEEWQSARKDLVDDARSDE